MAHFHRVPGDQRISTQTLTIGRDSIQFGLWGYLDTLNRELDVRSDNYRVRPTRGALAGNSRHWLLAGSDGDVAKLEAVTEEGVVVDSFRVRFTRTLDRGSEISVVPITADVCGHAGPDGLIVTNTSEISVMVKPTFRAGDLSNAPRFTRFSSKPVRLGVFAARKSDTSGGYTRAVILMLPERARPDKVLFGITHGFYQRRDVYEGLGYSNPLSVPLIQWCAHKFVLERWGPQMLATGRDMALVLIVRAAGIELGPFAGDGKFTARVLEAMAHQTNLAFSYNAVEAFTFSSGIDDFNGFVSSIATELDVRALYNIDPQSGKHAISVKGAVRKQIKTPATKGFPTGFEYMPIPRWTAEPNYAHLSSLGDYDYLHNLCMRDYGLNIAMEM